MAMVAVRRRRKWEQHILPGFDASPSQRPQTKGHKKQMTVEANGRKPLIVLKNSSLLALETRDSIL